LTHVIGEIQKNAHEIVRASLTEYKEKERIDIRVHYQAGADPNDYQTTRKGISLSLDQWGDFKELMGKVDRAVGERKKKSLLP